MQRPSSEPSLPLEKPLPHSIEPDDGLPVCATCGNQRIIKMDVPVGDPLFGQFVPCPDCGDLARKQHMARIYRSKQERIQQYTQADPSRRFDNFELSTESERSVVRLAHKAATEFARDPSGWLVLYGPPGTGKSHLASAIVNYQESLPVEERRTSIFMIVPALLDMLRSGYENEDYTELFNLCQNVDILILDDLGTEKLNEWAYEKLFQIINHRYWNRLPTVIITNCSLDDLDDRIRSRLKDVDLCQTIKVLAPDYRTRMRRDKKDRQA
jgi:DNA replication protein DnaC